MKVSSLYLVAYNLASCSAWSYILTQGVLCMLEGAAPEVFFKRAAGHVLLVTQTCALMEVVHAALGLVKSPVVPTAIQVLSRVGMLWLFTYPATSCHKHWSLYLMALSWACVEVPRYLFYALNLLPATSGPDRMPYALFWLRYSLFMVLYPTGISGEILQQFASYEYWNEHLPVITRLSHVLLLFGYVPASPFMVWNMWMNRKNAFKKRKQAIAEAEAKAEAMDGSGSGAGTDGGKKLQGQVQPGLVWPVTNPHTGERSTSKTNQAAWASSVEPISKDAAESVRRVHNWRKGYAKQVLRHVEACKSYDDALKAAHAGLEYLHNAFQFIAADGDNAGKERSLREVMEETTKLPRNASPYFTGTIEGKLDKPTQGHKVKIPYKGHNLQGETLKQQLDEWVSQGTMEASAADSIKLAVENEETWFDLSDRYFVLLGATSAMGPLDVLLEYGANIVAIDLDRPQIWEKLINKTRKSCGSIIFPMKQPMKDCKDDTQIFQNAGANLLAKTPEIAMWLRDQVVPDQPLTIGNYTYLDGALHVQLSLACDAIMEFVCKARPDTSIAFLCTPTDDHVVPKAAMESASRNEQKAPMWQKMLANMNVLKSSAKSMRPAHNENFRIVDGIINPQGPNYALAKRIQHWRAIIAREEGRHIVSTNVAPSTSTASVTSNPLFAAGYIGWKHFPALEVMNPETSRYSMCTLLVHDLRNPKSVANPKSVQLDHPLELMTYGAFHGGVWRCAYTSDSVGPVSVVSVYLEWYAVPAAAFFASLVQAGIYVGTGKLFVPKIYQ